MKKIYTSICLLMFLAGGIKAQTLCTIDMSDTTTRIKPPADSVPHIVCGQSYTLVLQTRIPSTIDTTVATYHVVATVDSVKLDSVQGLPTGITWDQNPKTILGGGYGCITISGTTTDTAGTYTLAGYGYAWFHLTSPLPLAYVDSGKLNVGSYQYYLVVDTGAACAHVQSGINNLNSDLNSAISIYPNPNSGVFEFRLSNAQKINGELDVYDMTGRKIFNQRIETAGFYNTSIDLSKFAKGLYTLQVRTPDGFGSKRISIE